MDTLRELDELLISLNGIEARKNEAENERLVTAIFEAAAEIGQAFSGSWLGYHSRVYYRGLQKPPPGAHFSQEWGLSGEEWIGLGSKGDWTEFDYEYVKSEVLRRAGNPNLQTIIDAETRAKKVLLKAKNDLDSIIATELSISRDEILIGCQENLKDFSLRSKHEILDAMRPNRQVMTRDTIVLGQGTQVPPHIAVQLEALSLSHLMACCSEVEVIAERVAAHLNRKNSRQTKTAAVAINSSASSVFIGHGQSSTWKELKDFLSERLKLSWDEFNRVPVAGLPTTQRLSEMLNKANFAFLVLTAEDEKADGKMQARANVIHEAGLFQGRLGFSRAIILLEGGCDEFSNIHGLGQIRFERGKLNTKFDEIRQVLEREGIVA